MTKKWVTLMYDGALLGYVKLGTKISEISAALKEASAKEKVEPTIKKVEPVKTVPVVKKASAKK